MSFFGLEQSKVQNRFPVWEELLDSGEQPLPGFRLTLERVEQEVYMLGEEYDFLHVVIENVSEQLLTFGKKYFLGYYHEGTWYTVWVPPVHPTNSLILEPGGVYRDTYEVPAGLLEEDGTYRFYISGVGYYQWQGGERPYQKSPGAAGG